MVASGTISFLSVADGANQPGLYYHNGTKWVSAASSVDIASQYPPIFLQAGEGVTFNYNTSTKYLTINSTAVVGNNLAGTSQTSFKINVNNTSAQSSSLKFERGSAGADSQLLWDETNDRFDVGLDTGTLVPLRCSQVVLGTASNNVGIAQSGNNLVLNVNTGGSIVIQVN